MYVKINVTFYNMTERQVCILNETTLEGTEPIYIYIELAWDKRKGISYELAKVTVLPSTYLLL